MASKYGEEYGTPVVDPGFGGDQDYYKMIGMTPNNDRSGPSPSNSEIQKMIDPSSGGLGDLVKSIFTDKASGNLDARTLGMLGGALAGGLGALTPNNQKVGYQNGIPRYTATRNMVTAPPAGSRPGAGGVNYGGDVKYTTSGAPTGASSSGGGGSSALGNIAKVAGGAGLAALLGNYLSKSGGAGNLASIFKGFGGNGQPYKPTNPTLSPNEDEGDVTNPAYPEMPEYNLPPQEPEIPPFEMPEYNIGLPDEYEAYAKGGSTGRYLQGDTDGMADKIPARIGQDQPAALSHGEFVVPADVVSHLGNGNSDAGAQKLYSMMDKIRMARTGTKKQGKRINPDKFMPGGLAGAYAGGGKVQKFAGETGSAVGLGSAANAGITGTEQAPASWAGEYITDMLGKGRALSEAPYQQYGGPLTAGASNLQQQAFNTAGNLSVPGSVGQAAQTAGDIANKAQNTSYNPTQFTNQFQAPDKYQNTTFTSGNFGQDQAQQYMNPYLQASLNPQLAEARRQSDITAQQNNAAMTKAGAFGGGRQAILTAENQRNLGTNLADITGKGYNTAYQNAMSQFNADQARNLQAQQASEQSKQFGAGQGMTAAQAAAQYGQAANQASEQSKQFGADLGLKGLQTGIQAAQTQGNLGIAGGQLGLQQLQEQANLGNTQRGIEAEGIAADKAAFEQARDNPYKMVQFQQSLLNGLPITATNYNTMQPTKLQEILAGAGGGAKLAGNNTDSGFSLDQLLGNLGFGGGSANPK
jgi:hypothetical protein